MLDTRRTLTFALFAIVPIMTSCGTGQVKGPRLEPVTMTIADASVLEGSTGTTILAFTVSLDRTPAAGFPVSVEWSTGDGTAVAGTDYEAGSGALTFAAAGPQAQTIEIVVLGDDQRELDEQFTVVLSNPVNVTLARDHAVGTILADEMPRVSISGGTVDERDAGTTPLVFTVTISADPAEGQSVLVDWATADGTATAPADYVAASGTLTFVHGGSLVQQIMVQVVGDAALETDETLAVVLSGYPYIEVARASGTIRSSDFPGLSISDASVVEGTPPGTTSIVFDVSLDAPPAAGYDVQVSWATEPGTATAGSDYLTPSGTLTFTSGGSTTQTISIPVVRDTQVENDETFTVVLSNPIWASLRDPVGVGTIVADDFPRVSVNDIAAFEGDAGTTSFELTVSLAEPPLTGRPVSVSWSTSDLAATSADDYQPASGTLTFAEGDALTKTITVSVNGDTTRELDENFAVALSNPQNAAIMKNGLVTILNDEPPLVSVSDASVVEGNGGGTELAFLVSLTGQTILGKDAVVSYATTDGTATAGSDYVAASGTLTFTRNGPSTQRVVVRVLGDETREPSETFQLGLTAVANAEIGGTAAGTIVNDELPALAIDDVTVSEGDAGTTVLTFTVTASELPEPGQDVLVHWATVDRSAVAGSDYTQASGTLGFTSTGADTASMTVEVTGDTVSEPNEELGIVLTGPVNAWLADDTGVGTIVDDDGVVIRVDPTSDAGTLDGLSWAGAFHTVQEGVDAADTLGGGQVWVAAAVYDNGGGTDPVLRMQPGVSVVGGFTGYQAGTGAQESTYDAGDPLANETVLDGAGTALHVVVGANDATLDGFTVRGGRAAGTATTSPSDPDRRGAGMDNTNVSPVVANCLFTDNVALGYGGAMYNAGTSAARTRPHVHDTQFVANDAFEGGGTYSTYADLVVEDSLFQANAATGSSSDGGGFSDYYGKGRFTRCTFEANTADDRGGGGRSFYSAIALQDCVFDRNVAGGSGGGWNDDSGVGTRVTGSVFVHNQAAASGGALFSNGSGTVLVDTIVEGNLAWRGGGIANWGGTQRFYRVRIANNRARSPTSNGCGGGGMFNQEVSPRLVDCIIEGNTTNRPGGGICNYGASPTLVNCTLVNDVSRDGAEIASASYPLGFGGSGSGNVLSEPTAINSIISNATLANVFAVYGSLTVSYTSDRTTPDPLFHHVPVRTVWTALGSTTSVVKITSAATYFAVGDVAEIGDDGVPRTVTAVDSAGITVSPPFAVAPDWALRVDNWGPGTTDVDVDLRLRAISPCIDAGDNTALPADADDLDLDGDLAEPLPVDFTGLPRVAESVATPNTGNGTAPLVDRGAIEWQAQ